MRISKIVCDGCGKEIHGNPIRVFAEKVKDNGDFVDDGPVYASEQDFCEGCLEQIKICINALGKPTIAKEPKPADAE